MPKVIIRTVTLNADERKTIIHALTVLKYNTDLRRTEKDCIELIEKIKTSPIFTPPNSKEI